MNCKHTFKIDGKSKKCEFSSIFPSLPHDENGLCIFHSRDVKWKEENHFMKYLSKLFDYFEKNNIEKFMFSEVHFTAEKGYESLHFEDKEVKTSLNFYNCIFSSVMDLDTIRFEENLNFSNCTFKKWVTINHCNFKELTLYKKSRFEQQLSFQSLTTFSGPVQIVNCDLNYIQIDDSILKSTFYLDQNRFKPDEKDTVNKDNIINILNTNFVKGFTIRNNENIGLLSLQESTICKESSIRDTGDNLNFSFKNNTVKSTLIFSGKEESFMFGADTIFNISEENIKNRNAKIVFEYCNILNFNNQTLDFLNQQKELEKVVMDLDKNNVTPYKEKYEIQIGKHDSIADIIQDTFTVISRCFERYFSTHLNIDFNRISNNTRVMVTISSRQVLDQSKLTELLTYSLDKVFLSREKKYDDFNEQRKYIANRIFFALSNNYITSSEFMAVFRIYDQNLIDAFDNMILRYKNNIIDNDKRLGSKDN